MSGVEKQKRKKQSEDAAQKGFFTVFHVGFQRSESLTGREVDQILHSAVSVIEIVIVMNATN